MKNAIQETKTGHLSLLDLSAGDTAEIAAVFRRFKTHQRSSGHTEGTIKYHEFSVLRFQKFLDGLRESEGMVVGLVTQITPTIVRLFQIWLVEQGYSKHTVLNTRRSFDALMNWCVSEGVIEKNPAKEVKKPEKSKVLLRPIPNEEVRRLFDFLDQGNGIHEVRNRAIFYLWFDTGLRLDEIRTLKVGQVDDKGFAVVRGKGNKERAVFVNKTAMGHFRRYAEARGGETGEPLWLGERGEMSYDGFKTLVKRISKRSGVSFTAHDIRRTFAIMSLKNGADLLSVSRQLGHSDVSTTQIYLNQDYDDLKAVHNLTSPVESVRSTKFRLGQIKAAPR